MRRFRPIFAAAICTFACGCGGLIRTEDPAVAQEVARQRHEELTAQLRDAVRGFCAAIETAGHRIAWGAPDMTRKRASLLLRTQIVLSARATMAADDPAVGWIDLWTLSLQLQQFLAGEPGQRVFGEQLPPLQETLAGQLLVIERRLRDIAGDEAAFAASRTNVQEFVTRNPMGESCSRIGIKATDLQASQSKGWFRWMPSVDLNPFSGVGTGISETAASIYAIRKTADRFGDIVELLPLQLGWNIESLRYDLESEGLAQRLDQHIELFTASTASIARTAESLPTDLRAELTKVLEGTGPQIAEVRAALAELDRACAGLDKVGTTFAQTAQSVEAMAAQLDTTLQTFQGTLRQLEGEPDPDAEPGKPFDVLEFDQTARSLTVMAAQLDTTLRTLRGIADDSQVDQRIAVVTRETSEELTRLIWTVAAALGGVTLAFFSLLLAYRRLAG